MTSTLLSIRQAGLELGLDPKVVKGIALGLAIEMQPVAKALLISRADFERIKQRVSSINVHASKHHER